MKKISGKIKEKSLTIFINCAIIILENKGREKEMKKMKNWEKKMKKNNTKTDENYSIEMDETRLIIDAKRPVELRFKNNSLRFGELKIVDYHVNECCEDVHVSWNEANNYLVSYPDVNALIIEQVVNYGLKVVALSGLELVTVDIPAYNIQNGYYSADLALIVKRENEKVLAKWDIADTTQDVEV